ncbi:RluA family pseudouridine synthase [Patescibacteria group bacterium]
MTTDIIYEDLDVLVINKPSGLMVHGDGKGDEHTLVDTLLMLYPKIKEIGEPAEYDGKIIERPGIVHRLDKDTSGVIVVARNQDAFLHLKKQFQDRTVQKTYRAFVYGNIKEDEGVIDKPIGRHPKVFNQWLANTSARGTLRDAVTEYKVLARGKVGGESVTYVELYPKTGRTHQIRAHLKSLNTPVICDPIYAEKRPCLLGLNRLALHALSLEIELPNGETKTFEAPLPEEFLEAERNLQVS